MRITFPCPQCEQIGRVEFHDDAEHFGCLHCETELKIPAGAIDRGDVTRCLACPSTDLFIRKDFPQRLGVFLVVLGLIGSTIAWYHYNIWWTYGILFGTVLIDLVLYLFVGDCLMCYRCGAIYRGLKSLDEHEPFNLETHERYRQAAARVEETTETDAGTGGLGTGG
jgi:hypothetical protein